MKIEFCCELLKDEFVMKRMTIGEHKNGNQWVEASEEIAPCLYHFCPYCGTKIEISVKDDKNTT